MIGEIVPIGNRDARAACLAYSELQAAIETITNESTIVNASYYKDL